MGKHYCIVRIDKKKNRYQLRGCYNHNDRIVNINNVDPSKTKENVHYIDTNGKSYEFMLDETLAELQVKGVPCKNIRKNAVLGVEVYMGFSSEAKGSFDLDQWAKASLDWLDKTYNPPNHEIRFISQHTGKEEVIEVQNIKHFVLHMDENCPHIHAFIVPIDDQGHLSSYYYEKQISPYYKLQNSYAERMQEFGLSRGERFSAARHEDIKAYYHKLEQAVNAELPEPREDERIFDYYKRANEAYQIAMIHHRDEMVKKEQEIIQIKSEAIINSFEDQMRFKNTKDVTEVLSRRLKLDEPVTPGIAEEVMMVYDSASRFKDGLKNHPDRDMAEKAKELYDAMVSWTIMQELDRIIQEVEMDLER